MDVNAVLTRSEDVLTLLYFGKAALPPKCCGSNLIQVLQGLKTLLHRGSCRWTGKRAPADCVLVCLCVVCVCLCVPVNVRMCVCVQQKREYIVKNQFHACIHVF